MHECVYKKAAGESEENANLAERGKPKPNKFHYFRLLMPFHTRKKEKKSELNIEHYAVFYI